MLTDPPTNTPMCNAGSRGEATSGLRESHLVVGLHPKAADFCRAARACRSRLALNLPQLLPVAHWNVLRITLCETEWEARRAQRGVSGREHVRGRIAVPQGDASGLFSQYAQFAWW